MNGEQLQMGVDLSAKYLSASNRLELQDALVDSQESKLISVSKGTPAAIINPSQNVSKILVLADVAWKPNDNEMENVTFDDYDWNKWKK